MREKEGQRKENKALILKAFSQFCLSDYKKQKKCCFFCYEGSGLAINIQLFKNKHLISSQLKLFI